MVARIFMESLSDSTTSLICFHSEYFKMFDGNGTEVFASHGWDSTSSNRSLQKVTFEESKNISMQVSLAIPSSYVKIEYGILKKPLALGRVNRFAVVCRSFAFVIKSGITCHNGYGFLCPLLAVQNRMWKC